MVSILPVMSEHFHWWMKPVPPQPLSLKQQM